MKAYRPLSDGPRRLYLPLLAVAVAGLTWIVANYVCDGQAATVCWSKLFLGVPCPLCGLTRAGVALLQADIVQAFYYNANSLLLYPLLLVVYGAVAYDLVANRTVTYAAALRLRAWRPRWWLLLALCAAFVALQVWVELRNLQHGI